MADLLCISVAQLILILELATPSNDDAMHLSEFALVCCVLREAVRGMYRRLRFLTPTELEDAERFIVGEQCIDGELKIRAVSDEGGKKVARILHRLPEINLLKSLRIRRSFPSMALAPVIATFPSTPWLRKVCLAGAGAGKAILLQLAEVLPKTNISVLNVARCYGGLEAIKAILMASLKLTALDIGGNKVCCETIAEALRSSCESLRTLSLNSSNIFCDGLGSIAEALSASKLTSLNLSDNEICDEGATALAAVLLTSKLTNLDLSNNSIREAGMAALMDVKKTNLTILTQHNLA